MKPFYLLLINTVIANITNMTVWFAIIFFAYLETEKVLATGIISGLFLVSVSVTGFWLGSLVDKYKKKMLMLFSGLFSLVIYAIALFIYLIAPENEFKKIESPYLWILVALILAGVIAGNIRSIALPTLVTSLVPEPDRDKANGLVGMVTGVAFLIVSVISGFLVAFGGMLWVFIFAMTMMVITLVHLWSLKLPEPEIVKTKDGKSQKIDIKGTIRIVSSIPGLFPLIFFTTINNFLGGVFMSLMDAYGLELVSVEVWGLLWGLLSLGFFVGGGLISKYGLGKYPLKSLFTANFALWTIASIFTLQPSIILLCVGMFLYLSVAPFVEAAEHTIIQRVVPVERQGRVFGFAQSLEMSASPLTAFLIGPITQFIFIPFMTTGKGVELIGEWFGTGPDRGIALVFTLTGLIGLCVTFIARQSKYYELLTKSYSREVKHEKEEPDAPKLWN